MMCYTTKTMFHCHVAGAASMRPLPASNFDVFFNMPPAVGLSERYRYAVPPMVSESCIPGQSAMVMISGTTWQSSRVPSSDDQLVVAIDKDCIEPVHRPTIPHRGFVAADIF
jgi:hypothetical protein